MIENEDLGKRAQPVMEEARGKDEGDRPLLETADQQKDIPTYKHTQGGLPLVSTLNTTIQKTLDPQFKLQELTTNLTHLQWYNRHPLDDKRTFYSSRNRSGFIKFHRLTLQASYDVAFTLFFTDRDSHLSFEHVEFFLKRLGVKYDFKICDVSNSVGKAKVIDSNSEIKEYLDTEAPQLWIVRCVDLKPETRVPEVRFFSIDKVRLFGYVSDPLTPIKAILHEFNLDLVVSILANYKEGLDPWLPGEAGREGEPQYQYPHTFIRPDYVDRPFKDIFDLDLPIQPQKKVDLFHFEMKSIPIKPKQITATLNHQAGYISRDPALQTAELSKVTRKLRLQFCTESLRFEYSSVTHFAHYLAFLEGVNKEHYFLADCTEVPTTFFLDVENNPGFYLLLQPSLMNQVFLEAHQSSSYLLKGFIMANDTVGNKYESLIPIDEVYTLKANEYITMESSLSGRVRVDVYEPEFMSKVKFVLIDIEGAHS